MIQTLLHQRIGQANLISLRLKNPKRSLVLSNGSLISRKDGAELPHDHDSEDHEILGYPGSKAKNGQGFSREKKIFRASIKNNILFFVFTTIHWRHTITILAFRLEKENANS